MNQNRKFLFIIITIVSVLSLVFVIVFATTRHKSKTPISQHPTEEVGPGTVVIDNTSGLQKVLLTKQYSVVETELIKFIQTKVDPKIDHAFIVNQPTVNRDGSVSFVVKTERPERQFEVLLDRSVFDKIVFSVPKEGFKETLLVYRSETD